MAELGARLTESDAVRLYGVVRARTSVGVAVAFLHIGAEQTLVVAGERAEPVATLDLSIGRDKIARAWFKHAPPTPGELENAIATIEDELMKFRAMIPRGSMLFTADADVDRIARISGDPRNGVLGLEAVETTFGRLAAIVLGRPASQDVVPVEAEFAATLTILREFMHHFGFKYITTIRA